MNSAMSSAGMAARTRPRTAVRERLPMLDALVGAVLVLSVSGYPLVATLPIALSLDTRVITLPYRGAALLLVLAALALAAMSRRAIAAPMHLRALFGAAWFVLGLRFINDAVIQGIPGRPNQTAGEFALFVGTVSLLPALALFIPLRAQAERKVFSALLAVSALTAVCAVVAMSFVGEEVDLTARADREGLNAISYATTGVVLLLLLGSMPSQRRRSLRSGALVVCGVALGAVPLVMAASKGPLLALAVAAAGAFIAGTRQRVRAVLGVAAAALLLGVTASGGASLLGEAGDSIALARRLTDLDQDASTAERLIILSSSWNVFTDNPVLGGAMVEPILKAYPHNILLEALMVGGIPFGVLTLVLVALVAWRAWRVLAGSSDVPLHRFAGMYALFSLTMSMLSGSLYSSPEFWAALAFVFSLRVPARPQALGATPPPRRRRPMRRISSSCAS